VLKQENGKDFSKNNKSAGLVIFEYFEKLAAAKKGSQK